MISKTLEHRFVGSVPEKMNQGVLYVALQFNTMMHLCPCGCGKEVVTPISPKDWKIVYDGQSISVNPSIGNWAFPCRSHYFIKNGKIVWAGNWSDEQIKQGRHRDLLRKRKPKSEVELPKEATSQPEYVDDVPIGLLRKIIGFFLPTKR